MDGHQAHRVEPVGLERGLALAGLGEVLGDRVGEEAAQVGALGALVVARQAHQLAQVGQPPVAAAAGQDREVIAGRHDGALDQRLRRRALSAGTLGREEARERLQPRALGLREMPHPAGRLGVAQRGPRAAAALPPRLREEDQSVGPDTAEGRRQHGEQRLLVLRVGERGEVGDAVADLLLRPVAAAADHVRRQPLLLERLLQQAQRARRAHEDDDVARAPSGFDLGAQPVRDEPRLGPAPRLRAAAREADRPLELRLVPAARVGDQQLDERVAGGGRSVRVEQPQRRVLGGGGRCRAARRAGHERGELAAQLGGERTVQDVEQRRRGAEVVGQPPHAIREPRPALAEDRHVGVPEAVDRLELVADREQVVALQRLEDVELEAVRVLELVDHDHREALRPRPPGVLVREQVAHAQLEIREVDGRARRLRGRVGGAEAVQQLVEEHKRLARMVVRARRPVRLPRLAILEAGGIVERLRAAAELRRVEVPGPRRAPSLGKHERRRARPEPP